MRGACNVFTRILLALFGEVPWRAVPVMPVEIMLLPGWFPFHLDKISYWSRAVLVPLLVLMALQPRARNPRGVTIRRAVRRAAGGGARLDRRRRPARRWRCAFAVLDRVVRLAEPYFPAEPRQRAIDKAVAFVTERLNGEDGLGGIFPAMANSLMMFDCLGYPRDHPACATAAAAIDKLVVHATTSSAYCQPCLSPVWDTALACHALMEVGEHAARPSRSTARFDWLAGKQVLDVVGDWAATAAGPAARRLGLPIREPALPRCRRHRRGRRWRSTASIGARYRAAIDRAAEWIVGMQSRNGGWGAFDADNTHYYLNHIPFADHGALLDPPTADVSARCLGFLAQLGYPRRPSGGRRRRSPFCGASRRRTAAGSAAGAPTTSTAPGRCSPLSTPPASIPQRRRSAAPSPGCSPGSAPTAAGARRRQLLARQAARRGALQHRLADRLGTARADGGGRGRTLRPWRAASPI